jgi:hypothetical protein
MNHEPLKASLPQDLFDVDRLPPRDKYGMVWHPDYDLIYNGLGVDDEGEAAWQFMKDMGLDFAGCEIDEELRDQYGDDDLAACAAWTPEMPEGDGWLLLGIYVGEDGPVAWYVRQGEQA